MSRPFLAVAAAAALLGVGGGRPIAQSIDDWDDDDVSRLKRKELGEAAKREREEGRLSAERRVAEQRRRAEEESRRTTEDFDKLRAGIDPTNDRPLSRQQRRALNRRNFPFAASAMSAGTAETQSGSGLQPASAAPSGETPNG